MKIVHCAGHSTIRVVEAPRPTPGEGEVLVQTVVSALCGSELKTYRGDGMPQGNSGHEAAGVVVEVGPGVTTRRAGERVGCSAIAGCGDCAACREGRYTWCPRFRFFGHMHAEYFVLPALACHRLPEDVPWEAGVLLTGDGLGVPYHSATKFAELGAEFVAVFGLGPIGLGHVLLQRHRGRRVIGIDRALERLRFAKEWGAEQAIEAGPSTDVVRAVRDFTGGEGAAVCIEAAGSPVTAKQCFAAVRTAGLVVFNGEQPAVDLSPSDDFIRRDIRAVGAWFYHFCEFASMLALQRDGLAVERLVTHRFPIEQAADAYQAMADARTGKVLLDYR